MNAAWSDPTQRHDHALQGNISPLKGKQGLMALTGWQALLDLSAAAWDSISLCLDLLGDFFFPYKEGKPWSRGSRSKYVPAHQLAKFTAWILRQWVYAGPAEMCIFLLCSPPLFSFPFNQNCLRKNTRKMYLAGVKLESKVFLSPLQTAAKKGRTALVQNRIKTVK